MQTRMNWSFWKGGSEEGVGWSTTEPEPEGGKRRKHAGHRVRERTPPWLEVSGLVGSLFFFLPLRRKDTGGTGFGGWERGGWKVLVWGRWQKAKV